MTIPTLSVSLFPFHLLKLRKATMHCTKRFVMLAFAISTVYLTTIAAAQTPPPTPVHGERVSVRDITLTALNADAVGVARSNAHFLVLDRADDYVYAYSTTTGAYADPSRSLPFTLPFNNLDMTVNTDSLGIAVTRTGRVVYVLDTADEMLYAYDFLSIARPIGGVTPEVRGPTGSIPGIRRPAQDIDISVTQEPTNIFAAGNRIWVVDAGTDRIYAFNTLTQERVTTIGVPNEMSDYGELRSLASANSNPSAIWLNDNHWYVLDATANNVFVYDATTNDRVSSLEFNLHDDNDNRVGIVIDAFSAGLFWVLDGDDNRIYAYRFTPTTVITAAASTTVNAGDDQTVDAGARVTLSGVVTDSNLSGDNSLAYLWRSSSVDCDRDGTVDITAASVRITPEDSLNTFFIAPAVPTNCAGYRLNLTLLVTGGDEDPATDTVRVDVGLATTVNAGADQVFLSAMTAFALNAVVADTDIEGDNELTYLWSFATSGCAALESMNVDSFLQRNRDDTPAIQGSKPPLPESCESYTITATLTVMGGDESPAVGIVQLVTYGLTIADAGDDQSVTAGDTVTLMATAIDTDPRSILHYAWSVVPTVCNGQPIRVINIAGSSAQTATFIAPALPFGCDFVDLTVRVTVSGGAVNPITDDLQVRVAFLTARLPASTVARIQATAGAGSSTVPPATTVTLQASITDTDTAGDGANSYDYIWSVVAGACSTGPIFPERMPGSDDINNLPDTNIPIAEFSDAATLATLLRMPTVTFTTPALPTNCDSYVLVATVTVTGGEISPVTTTTRYTVTATTANAGSAQTVTTGDLVTLTGSVVDNSGNPLTYAWSAPVTADCDGTTGADVTLPAADLNNSNTMTATFTAPPIPDGCASYDLTFAFTVTGGTETATDEVVITVDPADATTVDAGPDQTVATTATVTLRGVVTDTGNDAATTLISMWSAPAPADCAGMAVTVPTLTTGDTTTMPTATFTAPTLPDGCDSYDFVFTLTVTGGVTTPTPATVTITVRKPMTTVNAGTDQTVVVAATVILRGSATDTDTDRDNADNPLAYAWTVARGSCNSINIASPILTNANRPEATFPAPAIPDSCASYDLTFTLTVSHGDIADVTDTVTITVATLTTVNAGLDQTVTNGEPVTLTGSVVDNSGNPLTYVWSAPVTAICNSISGTAVTLPAASLNNSNAMIANFIAPTIPNGCARYHLAFTLTVTGGAETATDEVVITVDPMPATTVNAGDAQGVIMDTTVTLSGVVTDTGNEPASPLVSTWSGASADCDGMAGADVTVAALTNTGTATAPAATFDAPTVPNGCDSYDLTFTLTVTGGDVDNVTDTVRVTVFAAPDTTATAGPDQTVTAGEPVTLTGSAEDTDIASDNTLLANWSGATANCDATAGADVTIPALMNTGTATVPTATFTAPAIPDGCDNYDLTFTLTVTGGDVPNVTDTVMVRVDPVPATTVDLANQVTDPETVITLTARVTDTNISGSNLLLSTWSGASANCDGTTGDDVTVAALTNTGTATAPAAMFDVPAIPEGCDSYMLTFTLTVSGGDISPVTAMTTVTVRSDATAEVVNPAILPRLAQVIGAQSVTAVATRIENAGAQLVPTAQLRLGGVELSDYLSASGDSGEYPVSPASLLPDTSGLETIQTTPTSNTGPRWLSLLSEYANVKATDAKVLLGNSEFVLPLNVNNSGNSDSAWNSLALWGSGSYRNLSDDDDDNGISWDGDLIGGQFGVDTSWTSVAGGRLLGGVAVSWNQGDFDYSVAGNDGEYQLDLIGVHPYIGWRLDEINLWASVGYGQGEIEITDATGKASTDLEFKSVGIGSNIELWHWGDTTLRSKASVLSNELSVDSNRARGIVADDFHNSQINLGIEIRHRIELADGSYLEPTFGLGARSSSDNRGDGIAIETSVRHLEGVHGFTLEGRLHWLIVDDNYDEWGVEGLVRKQPNRDGQGLSFQIAPGYGAVRDEIEQMRQQDWVIGGSDAESDYAPRLSVEIDYRMTPKVFGTLGRGWLTPYSELVLSDANNRYRLGMRWQLGSPSSTDYSFHLDLFGQQHVSSSVNNTMLLKGELQF